MTLDRVRVEISTDRVPDDGVSVYLNIDGDIYDLPSLSRENHTFILSSLTNLSKKCRMVCYYQRHKREQGTHCGHSESKSGAKSQYVNDKECFF